MREENQELNINKNEQIFYYYLFFCEKVLWWRPVWFRVSSRYFFGSWDVLSIAFSDFWLFIILPQIVELLFFLYFLFLPWLHPSHLNGMYHLTYLLAFFKKSFVCTSEAECLKIMSIFNAFAIIWDHLEFSCTMHLMYAITERIRYIY